jgi:hypothetical protein
MLENTLNKPEYMDRALFILPDDRELQFPAIAAMQTWINGYYDRIILGTPLGNISKDYFFIPEYAMRVKDRLVWNALVHCGLELITNPVDQLTGEPGIVVDMSDARLLSVYSDGRHCQQACEIMCGVHVPVFPIVKRRLPETYTWGVLPGVDVKMPDTIHSEPVLTEDLIYEVPKLCGVIGPASWETYLAASLGLCVVEIVPKGRGRHWLSKWVNIGYRMIDSDNRVYWPDYIEAACKSVEAVVERARNGFQIVGAG